MGSSISDYPAWISEVSDPLQSDQISLPPCLQIVFTADLVSLSTWQGKVNPTQCEALTMVAGQVSSKENSSELLLLEC